MDRTNPYFNQVSLLVRLLPLLNNAPCFALKGGTAINLFYREMPRLSVDIDLVYIHVADRTSSLKEMTLELRKIGERISSLFPEAKIQYSFLNKSEFITRLLVEWDKAIVKIELSPVLRGTVFKPEIKRISQTAEEAFGFSEIPVVSFEDLFAGKIIAALDRQHPRDLFDIKGLLENEGISGKLKEAFIVYLISHNRRFLEILNPTPLDISEVFKTDFEGMTTHPVAVEELIEARTALVDEINGILDDRDKQFLLDFKLGNPDWSYFSGSNISEFPAVKWKLHNLNLMVTDEKQRMVEALRNFFGM